MAYIPTAIDEYQSWLTILNQQLLRADALPKSRFRELMEQEINVIASLLRQITKTAYSTEDDCQVLTELADEHTLTCKGNHAPHLIQLRNRIKLRHRKYQVNIEDLQQKIDTISYTILKLGLFLDTLEIIGQEK